MLTRESEVRSKLRSRSRETKSVCWSNLFTGIILGPQYFWVITQIFDAIHSFCTNNYSYYVSCFI
jgi:uncharacterized sodium:solute symporter family permease YidK